MIASALFVIASLSLVVPPTFEKEADGGSVNGQRITQPAGPRKQILAIIPDRTTGRDWGLRYLREAVEDFNRGAPDAVFCVGDLVQGYSRNKEHVAQERQDFLDIVGRLTMPFYPTAGNHDLVSGTRDTSDATFAQQYRHMFGPLYYAVELDLASVVILNSEDGDSRVQPGFSDEQLAWLDETLTQLEQRARPIILLFHRPLWDHKPTKWDERVQPMLVRHGVDYVIAGHYHALSWLPPRDGIPYLILGTCGGAVDQHPLAGQLQHTTFLVIEESGKIAPYHQIAGCTLPLDWMTKEDQDLAYKLKSSRNAVTITGAIPDPFGKPANAVIKGSFEVTLRNPLDRPVAFRFQATRAPTPWPVIDRVDGQELQRSWVSRTGIDTFNAATTDLDSPIRLELPQDEIQVAAGASESVKIAFQAPAQIVPPQPPPFEIIAQYADNKGRTVPIVLHQRGPIARTIALAESFEVATDYPIAVWDVSEYDSTEANSSMRLAKGGTAGSAPNSVQIRVTVPDSVFSGDSALLKNPSTKDATDANLASSKGALADPLGDSVRLILGEGDDAREYLVTFSMGDLTPFVRTLSADGKKLVRAVGVDAVLQRAQTQWQLTLTLDASALWNGNGDEGDGVAINLGVADNDETYHTQWRWLAPKTLPARVSGKP